MKAERKQNWTAQLKAKIYDNNGITLVELLVTLVIMAIIAPIVYNVFVAGQKTYIHQSSEVQFREDADYVTTMIMNEFFRLPFDYVNENCGKDCIQIVDSKTLNVHKQGSGAFYKIQNEDKETADIETIPIRFAKENEKGVIQLNSETLETESDLSGSKISYTCEKSTQKNHCQSGVILLKLHLSDQKTKQTLELESRFGF